MKIAFAKIAKNQIPFEIQRDKLEFSGNLKRVDSGIVECEALIKGDLEHNCDRCGKDIVLKVNENIKLLVSEGIYKDSEENLEDVIEFFGDFIDLEEIFISEIEAYKSDYFYCENCKNL